MRVLREALKEEDRIAFAVIFGSFVRRDTFRDVDLGIYLIKRLTSWRQPYTLRNLALS